MQWILLLLSGALIHKKIRRFGDCLCLRHQGVMWLVMQVIASPVAPIPYDGGREFPNRWKFLSYWHGWLTDKTSLHSIAMKVSRFMLVQGLRWKFYYYSSGQGVPLPLTNRQYPSRVHKILQFALIPCQLHTLFFAKESARSKALLEYRNMLGFSGRCRMPHTHLLSCPRLATLSMWRPCDPSATWRVAMP